MVRVRVRVRVRRVDQLMEQVDVGAVALLRAQVVLHRVRGGAQVDLARELLVRFRVRGRVRVRGRGRGRVCYP